MQSGLGTIISPKCLLLPRKNHWLKRSVLTFAFIAFDYLSTLIFCRSPLEEANLYARIFMENFGILLGLTLFVLVVNLPIYVVLSLDSQVVRLPSRAAMVIEPFVDVVFAWFVAGVHFSGGASWFSHGPSLMWQVFGALVYLTIAFLFVKPHKPHYDN
jgi:hypothetical protein